MYFFLFPFGYLLLRDAKGHLAVWRDALPTLTILIATLIVFNILPNSNFFSQNGFVDKVGALTASLTGFYVAGLLAVATFAAPSSALDTPIKVGPIYRSQKDAHKKTGMTRREYVCSMFGYLAFLSLLLSLSSALFAGTAGSASAALTGVSLHIYNTVVNLREILKLFIEAAYIVTLAHLIVTSGYGMYYLVFKIYSKDPKLKQPPSTPRIRLSDDDPK